ncbi:molybdenum cofactor guanylyltransferase [Melioribacter sp. Ez-97]|uniref:molybdenum cofactor guanylyltransferase n=1 Tax=Melioribacter sp. Ez-97 TaxID=3423434 RepID=UPI003ED9E785
MNIENAVIFIPDEELHLNSANLKIDEITLLEKIRAILEAHFEKVYVIAPGALSEKYGFSPTIENKAEGLGMVSAVYSALNQIDAPRIFLTTCLLPFITDGFVEFMKSKRGNLLVSSGNKICYQAGIFSKSVLPLLNLIIEDNIKAMKLYQGKKEFVFHFENFINRIAADIIDIRYEKFYFRDLLFEIKTAADFDFVRENLF